MIGLINNLKEKLFYQDFWRVGYFYDESDYATKPLEQYNIKWLVVDDYDYNADPFVFNINGVDYIAYEVYSLSKVNGKIKCVDLLNGHSTNFFDEVNKIKGHKSFPQILYYEGQIYCIPETSDLTKVSIYKFCYDRNKFFFESDILVGEKWIDTVILEKDNVFYLFASTVDEPFKQQLYISDTINGGFKKHPKSPICVSREYGRNGGKIFSNNLYRVSQNCTEYYGMNVTIHKINILTPTDYEEQIIEKIYPVNPYSYGLHTYTSLDNLHVFDGKVRLFRFSNFFRKTFVKICKKLNLEFSY